MKTTIEINDALLRRAKVHAAERNLSLKALVEQALRQYLDRGGAAPGTFKLRKHTFRGRGLQPGIDENDWATIRAMAYEGRGG
jgi:hypothetical protein